MYKIELFFQSENGIYTKEEETASNDYYKDLKHNRMLNRWIKILCPHIDIDKYLSDLRFKGFNLTDENKYTMMIDVIKREIEYQNTLFNENKKFTITISEF